MRDPFGPAAAAIDAVYAEPVLYTGGGLAGPAVVPVIWMDSAGERFPGAGNTVRTISCEIQKTELPARPAKSDRLVRAGATWKPNDITSRDDIGKWVLILERA